MKKDGGIYVGGENFSLKFPESRAEKFEAHVGKEIVFGVRPENIHNPEFVPMNTEVQHASAVVDVIELMGNEIFLHLKSGETSFVARVDPRSKYMVGQKVEMAFDMDNCHIFDAKTELAIR